MTGLEVQQVGVGPRGSLADGHDPGGRRQLIIPPDLAYGDRGAGQVIAPGETLIFVCDLVSI